MKLNPFVRRKSYMKSHLITLQIITVLRSRENMGWYEGRGTAQIDISSLAFHAVISFVSFKARLFLHRMDGSICGDTCSSI